jgi:uncharacterized membrane protein YeaQ/YmgE (transglycosylase-associated protein family)
MVRAGIIESPVQVSYEREVEMFHFIWILIIGLIVGALAKLITPGRDPGGIFVTMLLGVAGSLVGGFLGRFVGLYGPHQGAGFIVSLLGAILLLALYRFVVTHRHPTVGVHR